MKYNDSVSVIGKVVADKLNISSVSTIHTLTNGNDYTIDLSKSTNHIINITQNGIQKIKINFINPNKDVSEYSLIVKKPFSTVSDLTYVDFVDPFLYGFKNIEVQSVNSLSSIIRFSYDGTKLYQHQSSFTVSTEVIIPNSLRESKLILDGNKTNGNSFQIDMEEKDILDIDISSDDTSDVSFLNILPYKRYQMFLNAIGGNRPFNLNENIILTVPKQGDVRMLNSISKNGLNDPIQLTNGVTVLEFSKPKVNSGLLIHSVKHYNFVQDTNQNNISE